MRGIEGALSVLDEVARGAYASESLRRVWANVIQTERKLTATLVYCTLRKQGLWKHLLEKYCRRSVASLSSQTAASLVMGIAGVLELEHFNPGVLVNALVGMAKKSRNDQGESALVNAVLRTVMREAPGYIDSLRGSSALLDQALVLGVPGWVATELSKDWGVKDAKALMRLQAAQTLMSLRASPGVDRQAWADAYTPMNSYPSAIFASSIRIEGNPFPHDLPGYHEGRVTPQSESSIWAVQTFLSHWQGGELLDMCCGRGVKAGHIMSFCPDAWIEGWNISGGQMAAARKEFERLGVAERVKLVQGDALRLTPDRSPEAILLDVPCSGSGTWGRHPEGKWRFSRSKLAASASLQKQLFSRAVELLAPGGIIMYCTCSVFREENEKVTGAVLSSRQDLVELPIRGKIDCLRKGKPYGVLLWPESPWIDGFYAAVFRKRSS